MATQDIGLTCPAHLQHVTVDSGAMRVVLCQERAVLTFRCPDCGEQVVDVAGGDRLALLRGAHVHFVRLGDDRELADPQRIRLLPRMDGEWLADEVIMLAAAPDTLIGKLPVSFVMETVARRRSAARLRRGR